MYLQCKKLNPKNLNDTGKIKQLESSWLSLVMVLKKDNHNAFSSFFFKEQIQKIRFELKRRLFF